jgi:hypothetical protein
LVRAMSRTPDVRASGAEHYPRIPAPLGWGAVKVIKSTDQRPMLLRAREKYRIWIVAGVLHM